MKRVLYTLLWMVVCIGMAGCGNLTEGEKQNAPDSSLKPNQKEEADVEGEADSEDGNAVPVVKLEEVATIDAGDKAYRFGSSLRIKNDNNYTLCRYDGTELSGLDFLDEEEIAMGVYMLKRNGKKTVESTLVAEDGTVLIPWGNYVIETIGDRYLQVITLQKETKDENESIGYASPNMISLEPGKNDVMFTGYKQIYDLKARKFVSNVKCTTSHSEFEGCGDTLKIKDDKGDTGIYDAEGNMLIKKASNYEILGTYYCEKNEGKNIIYDSNVNRLFESTLQMVSVGHDVPYFVFRKEGKEGILDKEGNVIVENRYDHIALEKEAAIVKMNEKTGLIGLDGKEWCGCEYEWIEKAGWDGYYIACGTDKKYSLISSDGVIVNGVDDMEETLTFANNDDEKKEYNNFVLSDKDFTLKTQSCAEELGMFCIKDCDKDTGLYGMYETVSGTRLLDYKYDSIEYVGDYIYALRENKYTVYKKVIS